MTTALVTGGSGFIGRGLCRRLIESGVTVTATSRTSHEEGDLHWVQADLADEEVVSRLVTRLRPDRIYHLAGHVSGLRDLDAVGPSIHDTLVTSVNVLVAAARAGSTVVLAGSMEEPGPADKSLVPGSPYAAAKQAASSYGRMLCAVHGLAFVHLRIFMVYGPGQMDWSKLVPYVATSFLSGTRPKLSSGARRVDWVYVDDVVDAFIAAGSRPELSGRTVDIGSGQSVTIRAITERIASIVGTELEPDFGALPDRLLEPARVADVLATETLLGWKPRTELDDGLRATVDWYRSQLGRPQAAGGV